MNNQEYFITERYIKATKKGAKERGFEYELTPQNLIDQFVKQNGICVFSGLKLEMAPKELTKYSDFTASLDRINSSRGYYIDNIQWVHKIINRMKWALSDEEFLEYIQLIYHHRCENQNGPKLTQI